MNNIIYLCNSCKLSTSYRITMYVTLCMFIFSGSSCCIFHLLGTVPRSTTGSHLWEFVASCTSLPAKGVRDRYVRVGGAVLCQYDGESGAISHHVQQISGSFQGKRSSTSIELKKRVACLVNI